MKKSNYLNKIQWQDLRHLTIYEKTYNILLPYPFLGLSWYFAYQEMYLIAVIFSYFLPLLHIGKDTIYIIMHLAFLVL